MALTACETHGGVVTTMQGARALVAHIRSQYTAEMAASFAHAVTRGSFIDCPAAGYARFLCAAAWREV